MPKVIILKGLPASGKSTYAKQLVAKGNYKRVNKDDLRAMLDSSKHSKGNENFVLKVRDYIIDNAMEQGLNVVVDDTNFAPKHEESIRHCVELNNDLKDRKFQYEIEVKYFDTPVEECIKRDLLRPVSVGERVIRQMWRQYIAPVQQRHANDKTPAVIFDIDGTLALMNGRGPYEQHKVDTDTLVEDVATLLDMFDSEGYAVLVFSGRTGDDKCKQMTRDWLEDKDVSYDEFEMRTDGDKREDSIVKKEFYDKHKDNYDIRYVVDDRLQVCRMWHEIGLTLLKVGDPDLEF